MSVANVTATNTTRRHYAAVQGRRSNAAAGGGGWSSPPSSSSLALPKPLRWYVNWVRANEENAQSLERLSRTFAMIVSDPSDLINMEGCWTVSKLHAFTNQAILQTSSRAVNTSEMLTYLLRAVQELEILGEILVRKYCTQQTTWNVLLALQSVKCVLNMCVHRQFFLMPWVWHSIRQYLRRVVRMLWIPRYFLADKTQQGANRVCGTGAGAAGHVDGSVGWNQLYGQTIGPNGARLVIPRVVSNRRAEHRHTFHPDNGPDSTADTANNNNSNDDVATREEAEAWERESAEAVPFTFIDVLGMAVDAFLLVRPVLVLAAARHVFPATGGESIAKIPNAPKKKTNEGDKATGVNAPVRPVLTKEERARAAEEAALNNFPALRVTMEASSAQQTLFSSWRWWAIFAALDALVVLLSRFIRSHRIPVVYIDEPSASQVLLQDNNDSVDESSASRGGESGAGGEEDGAVRSAAANNDNGNTADGVETAAAVVANVPAVVSRDGLRLQQAMRNMGYTFLRDPFFTIVLKRFIYKHLVNGSVNKVPLLGSLLGFQVGYFLASQHYSFLYSLGQ